MVKIYIVFLVASFHVQAAIGTNYRIAKAYEKQDYNTAQQLLEATLIENSANEQALYNMACIFYQKKEFAQAGDYFKKIALSESSHKEQAWFGLANSLVQLMDLEGALHGYEEVLNINPDNERARKNYEIVKKMLEEQKEQKKQQQHKKENEKNKQGDKQDQDNNDQQSEQQQQQDSGQDQQGQDNKESQSNGDQQQQDKESKGNDNQPNKQSETDEQKKKKESSGQPKQQPGQKPGNSGPEQKPDKKEPNGDKKQSAQQDAQQKQDGDAATAQQQQGDAGQQSAQQGKPSGDEQLTSEEKRILALLADYDKAHNKQLIQHYAHGQSGCDEENNW